MQYQDTELFNNYEIKNWDFTPRLYKFFAAAAIFNILFLFLFLQANAFTTRGCESPLVGNICTVIDTVYLGSSLLETGEFVSKPYDPTKIEDADDITYIDVTNVNNQPLNYPEGYFALANPESQMTQIPLMDANGNFTMPSPNFNSFPTNPTITNPTVSTTNPLALPQVTPTPNRDAVTGKMDDSLFDIVPENKNPVPPPPGGTVAIKRPPFRNKRPTTGAIKPPTPEKTPEAKKPEDQPPLDTAAVTEFRPNKKPLEDFAADIIAKREDKTKSLDLTKNFKVKMVGELDKDGKLDPKKSRYTIFKPEEQGDQTMVDIGKAAIQAINDSGLFFYLKDKGIDKVEFTLVQDDEQIFAVINSSLPNKERAGTVSSGLNGLLGVAELTVKEPELLALVKAAKSEQQGKNVVLNFKIDKLVAQAMITKKLDEAEAKKKAEEQQNAKPNSTATVNTNQKTAK